MPLDLKEGISITRSSSGDLPDFDEVKQPHRDIWHMFLIQQAGNTVIEIDLKTCKVKSGTVLYIHPDQVHRLIKFEDAVIWSLLIKNESIAPEYLKFLDGLNPAEVLQFPSEDFDVVLQMAGVCLDIADRKQEKLYSYILKNSCNALVGFITSQYLNRHNRLDKHSRFAIINNAFKLILDQDFAFIKSPAEYAKKLNISLPYLNECVKKVTGYSVTHHIQQRIVLEAKRLLGNTKGSVKEIAGNLGYDDSSYFIRLFTKVVGVSPAEFRRINLA
ncbi:MAG: helix-turn-helix domain-containing protein [Mucilaginibacter sp.]|nr:helix-turn-helix domain-containing protein [Mucilaginibacter sp.]